MIRNHTDTIVIKPKTSRAFIYSMIGIGVIVFIASVAGAFVYGRWQLSGQLAEAEKKVDEQKQRYVVLNERYEGIQENFVQMRRQLHIDDSAYTALRQELELSNSQLAELGRELNFYRSIISPQDGHDGVRVQALSITPTEREGKFKYRLVLIQTLQEGKILSGTIKLMIKGRSGGETRTVQHPAAGQKSVRVRFKYFENITGTLELPPEFTPLEVKIDLAGEKNKTLLEEKWYPWQQVTAGVAS